MFFAKIVQTSGMTKEKTKFFFSIPECSLYYQKIVQTSGMTKEKTKVFFFFLECSLSYQEIVQMSGMAELWRTYCSSETYKKY